MTSINIAGSSNSGFDANFTCQKQTNIFLNTQSGKMRTYIQHQIRQHWATSAQQISVSSASKDDTSASESESL